MPSAAPQTPTQPNPNPDTYLLTHTVYEREREGVPNWTPRHRIIPLCVACLFLYRTKPETSAGAALLAQLLNTPVLVLVLLLLLILHRDIEPIQRGKSKGATAY